MSILPWRYIIIRREKKLIFGKAGNKTARVQAGYDIKYPDEKKRENSSPEQGDHGT